MNDVLQLAERLSNLVARREGFFASRLGYDEPYLMCDEAAEILGELLRRHGVDFEYVHGHSDEGSSHVWVNVSGLVLDPTNQGCNLSEEDGHALLK